MKGKKTKIFSVIVIALSIVIVLLSAYFIDGPEKIISTVRQANGFYLLLAAFLIFLFWFFFSLSRNALLKVLGAKIRPVDAFKVTMTGAFFNAITPSSTGGQPMQVMRMRDFGLAPGLSSSVVILLLIINNVVTLILGLFSIYYSYHSLGKAWFTGLMMILGVALSVLVTFLIASVIIFPRKSKEIIVKIVRFFNKKNPKEQIERLDRQIDSFYDSFRVFKMEGLYKLLPCAIFVAFQNISLWSIPHVVFSAFGGVTGDVVLSVCAACMVALISGYVPLPGAALGAEGAFLGIFGPLYKNISSIAIVVILWRVFTFYAPIIVGAFFTVNFKSDKEVERNE